KLEVQQRPDDKGASGTRNRVLLYLPDRNQFVMEVRTNSEQQIWTMRYAAAPPPLPTPADLRVAIAGDGGEARLAWKAPSDNPNVRYKIEHADGVRAWELDWGMLANGVTGTAYIDKTLKPGVIRWYRVCALTDGKETAASNLARTQPPIVDDL